MDLPDHMENKKKSIDSGYNLNDDLINEMKKKKLLGRINAKFSDISSKPAHELENMKMVIPPNNFDDHK